MNEENWSQPRLPQALATFVRRGVYTLNVADVRHVGITASQVHRWKKRGFLRALGAGAYVIQTPLIASTERLAVVDEHLRIARAVVDGIPGGYLSGRSAVLAHGLPVYCHPPTVELTRRPWLHTERDFVSRRPWGTDPVVLQNGLRVQPVAEAVIEVAAREGSLAGLITADAAVASGRVTSAELQAAAHLYGPRIGAADARLVARLADGRIESPAESTCRWVMHFADIPLTPQVEIFDNAGAFVARVDFLVDGTRIVLEVDGLEKYQDPDEARREASRQLRLEALGYVIVRVRTADLHALHHVVERVRAAMRAEAAA